VPQFLEEFCRSNPSLNDTIIGAISATEPLLSPASKCVRAFGRYLNHITDEDLCRVRREILTTTAEDLESLLPTVRTMADKGAVCVVRGGRASE
jgi:Zn-dependent M16 (insulinase) family peptidase